MVVHAMDIAGCPMPDYLGLQDEDTLPEEFTCKIDEVNMSQLKTLSNLEAHYKRFIATYYHFKDLVSRTTLLEEVAAMDTQVMSWITEQSTVMTTISNGSTSQKHKTA